MILEPECIGCLFTQMLKAFKIVKPDVSRDLVISAQKKLMKFLLDSNINEIAAPIVGKFLYRLVAETINVEDPYRKQKKEYNNLALAYYDDTKKIVKNADDPLFEAIAASAIGNTIDFAAQHEIDLINDLKNFTPQNFSINHYDDFRKELNKLAKLEGTLLILGDNTGEIVFDKLLVETIKEIYPNLEIVYAVRSAPVINDSTMEDAEEIGLAKIVKVIESCPVPGIDLKSATEEFKKYFYDENGFILSKGQGNFETLHNPDQPSNHELPDKNIYYLLKAKCNLMERIFNCAKGDLIFKQSSLTP
ncbi:MAG: DUF89 family protein [Candidatus Lokiarchaeota archaeon]|nr:DUF89 family protein [Candidatus Lokiarchaeota archaeon]MBD3343220.1 DUF89 family protein [Candidatus Lokiarchaeota archaeon]